MTDGHGEHSFLIERAEEGRLRGFRNCSVVSIIGMDWGGPELSH